MALNNELASSIIPEELQHLSLYKESFVFMIVLLVSDYLSKVLKSLNASRINFLGKTKTYALNV